MQPILSLDQLDPAGRYTYADYLLWKFQERVQLVRGYLLKMAAPSRRHQKISSDLHFALRLAFKGHPCQVYHAPFDVRLPTPAHHRKSDKDIVTVVQPDLCVICDRAKLDDRGCIGAPDLVVEILSPPVLSDPEQRSVSKDQEGNSRTEMNLKYAVYEESGVGEYWIVDPEHHSVQQFYRNGNDRFTQVMAYGNSDTLTSRLFPELTVSLPELFEEEEVG